MQASHSQQSPNLPNKYYPISTGLTVSPGWNVTENDPRDSMGRDGISEASDWETNVTNSSISS